MTALLEATSSWSVILDNGLVNGVVFIDLKKAFDTIDHQIILQKLENYGIDHSSLKWFKSYLTGRTQKCRVNDKLSNSTSVKCGIPQGSNFCPLLFLISMLMTCETASTTPLLGCLQMILIKAMQLTLWTSLKVSLAPN